VRQGWSTTLKESAITAAVAAALMLPMIGLYTSTRAGGLAVGTRWIELAFGVLLIFLGRIALIRIQNGDRLFPLIGGVLAIGVGLQLPLPNGLLTVCCVAGGAIVVLRSLFMWGSDQLKAGEDQGDKQSLAVRSQKFFKTYGPWLGVAVIACTIAFPWLPFADRRLIDLATLVLIYVMLGWGLNIVVGLAGLLDLGYVAFYAIGAYSFALLSSNYDMSFWVCLPIAAMLAAFLGILLGFPVLRLRGDYLAIVTLGFGEMIRIILINWGDVTKGPDGISGIPKPTFFGLSFSRSPPEGTESFHQFFDIPYASVDRIVFLFYVTLALALLINAFILRIRKLPIGRAWEALREDEIACRSLGLNPTNVKLSAFALGAMVAGLAGVIFAARQSFISPESFTFIESAIILAVVVLGGMGSQVGVVIAAILLIGFPEWFRELQDYRMLAFGGLMVAIMVWRPKGILSHREPTLYLHEDDAEGRR